MVKSSATYCLNINQEFQAGPEIYENVFPEAQARSDYRHIYSKGVRNVRAPLKPIGSRPIDIAWQKQACRLAKEYFPSVSFGSGIGHPHKTEDWDTLLNFMYNDEIPWILNQGVFGPNDVYMLWNEAEGSASNVGVLSASRTSNVVTIQYGDQVTGTPKKHMLKNGWEIVCQFDVLGVTNNQFGSPRSVTVIDENTFSFASNGVNGTFTNPSISGNFWRFHPRVCYRMGNWMAEEIKTNIPEFNLKTSISALQGVTQDNESNSATRNVYSNVYYIDHAIAVGRSDYLDYIDQNVYSYTATQSAYEKALNYFKAMIDKGYAAFGPNHYRVTEWNLWHNQGAWYTDTPLACKNFAERLKYLDSKPDLQHFLFCLRWQNSEWLQVLKPYNKTIEEGAKFRDWWYIWINERPPTVEITNNNPVQISTVREFPAVIKSNNVGFNIGQYEQSGTYNATKINNIINFWKSSHVPRARVASGDPSNPSAQNACRNLALAIKNAGIDVMFAHNAGSATDANWSSTVVPQAYSFVEWAYNNGINKVNMFNELDYRQTTPPYALTNSVQKQIDFYDYIKPLFPTMEISFALAQSSMEYVGAPGGWISRKIEVNTKGIPLTYNCYGDNGDFEQFKERILDLKEAFPNLRITEWNINSAWGGFPASVSEQVARIKEKFEFLVAQELINYFFTWNWDHVNNGQFSLQLPDGTFRPWYPIFFEEVARDDAGIRDIISNSNRLTI